MHFESLNVAQWTKEWAESNAIENSCFEEIPSTNDLAKQNLSKDQSDVKLYIADQQSSGRGRGTNTWSNPHSGQGLLCSWSISLDSPPQHTLGPKAGLALLKSVQEIWPSLKWSLKAPNDLYLAQGKIAGLLLETVTQGATHRLIIGLGFNVGSVPEDVNTATSLMSEEGVGSDLSQAKWNLFLDALYTNINDLKSRASKDLSDEERNLLLQAINANPLRPALLVDISPDGDLIAEDQRFLWGEL